MVDATLELRELLDKYSYDPSSFGVKPMTTHIKVLDKGFIELVARMGDDRMVVNAARVSFAQESDDNVARDIKLIRYLADNKHVSPFYHPHLCFRVKAPISVHRQWERHRIGTAMNSESTRYIEVKNEYYIPEIMRKQSKSNKQGSEGGFDERTNEFILTRYRKACENSYYVYETMLKAGVAKEEAREVLPLCTYLTWVWTASLYAVIHFLELREDSHAQEEIRSYAHAMRELVQPHFPISLAAFATPTK